jgi:hypothetical protein
VIVFLSKNWRLMVIASFLAIQLLAPLHYYLIRDDKNDERFAWRMFSPTRGLECDVDFFVDGRDIGKGQPFHEAWWTIASRGRLAVIEAMGEKLCATRDEVGVKVECTAIDGSKDGFEEPDLCRYPDL